MENQNRLYQLALTLVTGVGNTTAKYLLQTIGEPEAIFREKKKVLEKINGITARTINSLQDPEVLKRAEQEMDFIEKNRISIYFFTDEAYPARLKECPDSPTLFYYKGNTPLNPEKVLSIVGTRHASEYGRKVTDELVAGLAAAYPELLIISGLAYGIDIMAHKAALKEDLPTVAVLAHGLDRIYPGQHRDTAIRMLERGGLLTDFMSGTNPDRPNFVMRNRIVAGLADATLVVESAAKGGALITAEIAFSYGRDVLAVPGKTSDVYSQGCNKIIKQNKAALVETTEDIINALCWDKVATKKPQAIQTQLFPDLTTDEKKICDILLKEDMQVNLLSVQSDIPIYLLTPLLFEMEMKGILKCLPGGVYRLISG